MWFSLPHTAGQNRALDVYSLQTAFSWGDYWSHAFAPHCAASASTRLGKVGWEPSGPHGRAHLGFIAIHHLCLLTAPAQNARLVPGEVEWSK